MRPMRGRRSTVLEMVRGQYTVERGSLSALEHSDSIAVLAHYSDHPRVSRSFRELVGQLAAHGYTTLIVSAASPEEPLEWDDMLPDDAVVVRKPNVGYDFGSWALGLTLGPVSRASRVLIANDSMIGPFTSLHPALEQFESTTADVWGMTDSYQYMHHVQTYMLGFVGGVLAEPPLQQFWRSTRHEPTKWDVIRRGELRLSRVLAVEGYALTVRHRADEVVPRGENPVIRGWLPLLGQGFPFVKREIVRNPEVAPRANAVEREVLARSGTPLPEWL